MKLKSKYTFLLVLAGMCRLTKQTCPSEILYLYLLHNQYITL